MLGGKEAVTAKAWIEEEEENRDTRAWRKGRKR